MRRPGLPLRQRPLRRSARAGLWCAAAALALCGLRAGGLVAFLPCPRPSRGSIASHQAGRPDLARRGLLLSLPVGLAALEPLAAQAAAVKDLTSARAEISGALSQMKGLQRRWPELEKATSQVSGEAVTQALSSNSDSTLEISVPAGSSLGVEIEGLEVTQVTDRSFGWAVGDKIEQINGEEVLTLDQAKKGVQKARDANQPIKVIARRLVRSPFVTLERSLRAVYQDSDRPLPETDDVMKKVASLRSFAPSLTDGFASLGDLKPGLDGLVSDLEGYLSEENPRPAPAAKASSSGGGGGNLDGLFG